MTSTLKLGSPVVHTADPSDCCYFSEKKRLEESCLSCGVSVEVSRQNIKKFYPSKENFTEMARQMKSPPQITLSGLRMGQTQQTQASAKNRRLAAQMANRPGVQAALGAPRQAGWGSKVKNRLGNQKKGSLQGRLGVNKMTGFHSGNRIGQLAVQQRIGSGRGGQRRGVVYKRGGIASNRTGVSRGKLSRGGISRGMGRGIRGGRGKPQSGRGAIGGARGHAHGRGRGVQSEPTKSKDVLDKELDEYMTHSKGHLDAELDEYMQNTTSSE